MTDLSDIDRTHLRRAIDLAAHAAERGDRPIRARARAPPRPAPPPPGGGRGRRPPPPPARVIARRPPGRR